MMLLLLSAILISMILVVFRLGLLWAGRVGLPISALSCVGLNYLPTSYFAGTNAIFAPLAGILEPVSQSLIQQWPFLALVGNQPLLVLAGGFIVLWFPMLRRRTTGTFEQKSVKMAKYISDLIVAGVLGIAPTAAAVKLPRVQIEVIGRIGAGKSELIDIVALRAGLRMMLDGLSMGFTNPLALNELIKSREDMDEMLTSTLRSTTLDRSVHELQLMYNAEAQATIRLLDSPGQLVSTASLTSSDKDLTRNQKYRGYLGKSDVMWLVFAAPSRSASRDEIETFLNEIQLNVCYLRDALNQRSKQTPVSVAVVLARVDVRYDSPEEIDGNDRLFKQVFAVVKSIKDHPGIYDIAVIPVTAWGFQSAERVHLDREDGSLMPGENWLLKKKPRPWNVTSLLVWSILQGLKCQSVKDFSEEQCQEIVWLSHQLNEDLQRAGGGVIFSTCDEEEDEL